MKRDKRAIFLIALTFLLAGYAGPAPANDQNQDPPGTGQLLIKYLAQDMFLRPGVGLDAVRIGTPFAQVQRRWGMPVQTDRHNLIDEKWIYEIAGHTRITLTGSDHVKAIRVKGAFNSPFRTTEGASFGMGRDQLSAIYGLGESGSNKLTYDERGVGFVFEHGRVSEIRIFSPD